MSFRPFEHITFSIVLRFITVTVLAVWFGGFTFYSTAVISTSQAVLHSMLKAGLITQQVTNWLNWISVPTLIFCAINAFVYRSTERKMWWWIMLLALTAMVFAQAGLFPLHRIMDSRIVNREIGDEGEFFKLHRLYLMISTAQWCATLAYLFASLVVWAGEGRYDKWKTTDVARLNIENSPGLNASGRLSVRSPQFEGH